jgi:hypothetical protein
MVELKFVVNGVSKQSFGSVSVLIAGQELLLADETPVNLTDHPKREIGKCKLGYNWAFLAPDTNLFVFVFNVSRSGQTPVEILGGSKFRDWIRTCAAPSGGPSSLYEWRSDSCFFHGCRYSSNT